jgi:hypothetical protein
MKLAYNVQWTIFLPRRSELPGSLYVDYTEYFFCECRSWRGHSINSLSFLPIARGRTSIHTI